MWTVTDTPRGLALSRIEASATEAKGIRFSGLVDPKAQSEISGTLEVLLGRYSIPDWTWVANGHYNPLERRGYHLQFLPLHVPKTPLMSSAAALAAIATVDLCLDPVAACIVGAITIGDRIVNVPEALEIARLVPPRLRLYMAARSAQEAAQSGRPVGIIESLIDLMDIVRGRPGLQVPAGTITEPAPTIVDMDDIAKQDEAKRWFTIAVAGRHHILAVGPPGQGKTMLAYAAAGLQPKLTKAEWPTVRKLYELCGQRPRTMCRPFKSISKDVNPAALFGGGSSTLQPGIVSLTSSGILHIDEFMELTPARIESLRLVLQDREVHITRTNFKRTLPAAFQLIATANRCPCTWYGHPSTPCTCAPRTLERYRHRLSGAMRDRLDIIAHVDVVPVGETFTGGGGEGSAERRRRVARAWETQFRRQGGGVWNAHLTARQVRRVEISRDARDRALELGSATTMRGFGKLLKLSRTIADLENCAEIRVRHVEEAITAVTNTL